jgi:hypothetical protein
MGNFKLNRNWQPTKSVVCARHAPGETRREFKVVRSHKPSEHNSARTALKAKAAWNARFRQQTHLVVPAKTALNTMEAATLRRYQVKLVDYAIKS